MINLYLILPRLVREGWFMDSLDLSDYGIVEADVAPLSLTFPPWFSCSSLARTSLPLRSGHAAAIQAGIKNGYTFKKNA